MRLSFYLPCCIVRQFEKWQIKYTRSPSSGVLTVTLSSLFCFFCLALLSTRTLFLEIGLMCSSEDIITTLDLICANLTRKKKEASYFPASSLFPYLKFDLCSELCDAQNAQAIEDKITCHSRHLAKSLVFTLTVRKSAVSFNNIVIKSISKSYEENASYGDDDKQTKETNDDDVSYWKKTKNIFIPDQHDFEVMLNNHAKIITGGIKKDSSELQLILESADVLYNRSSGSSIDQHRMFWTFIEDQEFAMSLLYGGTNLFPTLLGICDGLYSVEYLETLPETFFITSHLRRHEKLLKAIEIIKYVNSLDTFWYESLHLCDTKMSHFGFTNKGKVKFVDLDSVMTENQLLDTIRNTPTCEIDEDCSYFDCLAKCDLQTGKCIPSRSNTNLQVVCSRVFLGEGSSPLVSIVGLLDEEEEEVAEALQLCKTNPGMTAEPLLQVLYQAYHTQKS